MICPFCEKEFEQKHKLQKYCTSNCVKKQWYEKNKLEYLSKKRINGLKYYYKNIEKEREKSLNYYYKTKHLILPEKKELKKKYMLEYYAQNKSDLALKGREYYSNHLKEIYKRNKEWRIRNQSRWNKFYSDWKRKNKGRFKEYNKKYESTLKGKITKYKNHLKRIEAKKCISHNFTIIEWINLKNQTNGYCFMCDKNVGLNNISLDHKYPLCKAHEDFLRTGQKRAYFIDDIQPICLYCNIRKGGRVQ